MSYLNRKRLRLSVCIVQAGHTLSIPPSGVLGILAGNQSRCEGLGIKQRFYLTSPAWGPDGRLECSQGESADLFICPSCILLEYHLPSHPPFKGWEQLLLSCTLPHALALPLLTDSLSSLPPLSTLHSWTPQSWLHIFTIIWHKMSSQLDEKIGCQSLPYLAFSENVNNLSFRRRDYLVKIRKISHFWQIGT